MNKSLLVIGIVLLLLTPITAFSTSSVIPTLTDQQAARILEDTVSSIHIILSTDSDSIRQFHLEKLAGILENITGYKEDISVSMAANGLNIRIDPDPDGTSTSTSNGDRSGLRLVQDPCSNQPGSARMTYPYENRTDCEVEQWIECIENSGTVKWAQLHCDDLQKLFDDPRAPAPPPNNNTDQSKNDTGTGTELTPTPPPPSPTDYCAEGAMRPPDYDEVCTGEEENEGENEQPLVPLPEFGEDEEGDTGEDQGSEQEESSSDDNSEEEEPGQPLPQFG